MNLESLMKLSILLLTFCNVVEVTINRIGNFHGLKQLQLLGVSQRTKRFIFYRANYINERNCECPPSMVICKCCENVTLLLIKVQKKLCANFIYQRNGLNIDISLDSTNIISRTVNRSLSLCPQFVIITKHQEWRINYTCQIIKTELPMVEGAQMGITMMPLVMTTRNPSGMLVVSLAANQSEQGNSTIPSTTMRLINLLTTINSKIITERPTNSTVRPLAITPARPPRMLFSVFK